MSLRSKNSRNNPIHLISYLKPSHPVTEQYRSIRTNIMFSSVDDEIRTIMVTSPEPSDGKSTTASNLAIVLAQQGKQVLLVDTDLRKPSIHYAFATSNRHGLTNVLTRKSSLEDAILQTYVEGLNILPSGGLPPNPSELIGSRTMESIIENLSHLFDFIIFDTPPLLAVSDAQILANKCDGTILVVSSGKTSKEKALEAKELLVKAKSRLLGVIVNGVKGKSDYYNEYN